MKQECIPLGCVPSAVVAVSGERGVSAQVGGVCPGGCLPMGRVSAWGVSDQGGYLPGAVCPGWVSARGCLHRDVCPEECTVTGPPGVLLFNVKPEIALK